ncbi:MAG: hypothetical protein QNI92_04125 [Desulfobacterales bacterium]|nr:hypothetical protein [Desulfobacterales bacterium]MDJ0914618.1 hypothetical protein [Desulfobacterales bacterium]
MDVKSFCDTMEVELIGWKAKVYDVIRRTNQLPDSEQDKVMPMIKDLYAVVDDLNDRIDQLESECPAEWDSQKSEIENRMSRMQDRWKTVWGVLGESEYGVGGA